MTLRAEVGVSAEVIASVVQVRYPIDHGISEDGLLVHTFEENSEITILEPFDLSQ